jgi:hypothetical protein
MPWLPFQTAELGSTTKRLQDQTEVNDDLQSRLIALQGSVGEAERQKSSRYGDKDQRLTLIFIYKTL